MEREKERALKLKKYRFSETCNETYSLDKELDGKTLLDFIMDHHREQKPRLKQLADYYEVKNHTIYNRKDRESHLSDSRLAHSYARYISSFIQGYLVGNPVRVKHNTDSDLTTAIDELNKAINANRLNADITLDLSIYGRAYEIVYRTQADADRVSRLDPLTTFVIYDNSIESIPVAGVRYWYKDGKVQAEVYFKDKIEKYIQNDTSMILDDSRSHYYNGVPIIEYSNNRFRQGDFEPVLDLIDAYDMAQSDTSNYMTDLNNAMLVITGRMKLTQDEARQMKERLTMLLIPAEAPNGTTSAVDAKYIYKQYDVTGVESYKNRLQNDIHRFTNTPDMNDEKFSGNASGESMKYKLFGLDQVRADKETRMIEGMKQRYHLLFNLKTLARELAGADANDLQFIFTPNIPRAFYEELKAFIEAGGVLSQETLLTITALVEDPAKELERIENESGLKPMVPMAEGSEDDLIEQTGTVLGL